ncbi:MAG: helix-turn-helix domain-containing protein [Chloroflexi bacterium]|nr:helix-turn-helix domain-containing protein [Chloroflexota bacterium]
MIPEELLALITGGEGETVEFKRSVAELEKAVETVAAFANTRGGVVLIGVHPRGRIEGVEVGQTTRERIVNRITGNTDPAIYPSVEHVTAQDRVVVAITVPESADKPHLAFGRAFKRVGAVTAQMDRAEYERLLLARRQLPFDRREAPDATTDDLDEVKVRWYLQRAAQERAIPVDLAAPLAENLKRLGVAAERDGRLVLTTTALLLFGKQPQQFLSYTMVRIARFQGTTPLNFIDRLDCFGTLPEMIDEAERFVRRNTRVAAKITGFERREITEYPYPAIREAIANAVAHRDYDRADVEVRVSVFADRIEVQSPGRLPAPLTVDTLGEEYALRNRQIAELLFNIRYIERWNTGIMRMRRWMAGHGLPPPIFQEMGQTFKVTFTGPGESILDLIPEEGVTDLRALGLNERQVEALRLMVNEDRKLTNREYRQLFDVDDATAFRDLSRLVKSGQAKAVGLGRNVVYQA